ARRGRRPPRGRPRAGAPSPAPRPRAPPAGLPWSSLLLRGHAVAVAVHDLGSLGGLGALEPGAAAPAVARLGLRDGRAAMRAVPGRGRPGTARGQAELALLAPGLTVGVDGGEPLVDLPDRLVDDGDVAGAEPHDRLPQTRPALQLEGQPSEVVDDLLAAVD